MLVDREKGLCFIGNIPQFRCILFQGKSTTDRSIVSKALPSYSVISCRRNKIYSSCCGLSMVTVITNKLKKQSLEDLPNEPLRVRINRYYSILSYSISLASLPYYYSVSHTINQRFSCQIIEGFPTLFFLGHNQYRGKERTDVSSS